VSLVDLTLQLMQPTDAEQINEQFTKTATDSSVLEAWDGPIVSSDIIGNPASCILDLGMTTTVGTLVKLVGWYDNEWGYANRMIDTLCYLEEIGQKGSDHH
jgi:glyceraldehyde 3-phosphate dehydrogenase